MVIERPVIDSVLVRRLVDRQFPQWATLPLRLVDPAGSDHVIHRLGDELAVRLPRHCGAIDQARREFEWLPRLAPGLPLRIPAPVAVGQPGLGYPWEWSVSRWLDGEVATADALGESRETAVTLAHFLTALQELPAPGSRKLTLLRRDRPLVERDEQTRAAIAALADVFDAAALTRLWDEAVRAPGWRRPPVWFHGDFHTGNLLVSGGRVSAVIDFGGLGVGDPACDLTVAFSLMAAETRAVFRETLGVDEPTWTRGRGWALAGGLNAYRSYAATEPRVAAQTTRQITSALAG